MCSQEYRNEVANNASAEDESRLVYQCESPECGAMMLGSDRSHAGRCPCFACNSTVRRVYGACADQHRELRARSDAHEATVERLQGELDTTRRDLQNAVDTRVRLRGHIDACASALGFTGPDQELPAVIRRIREIPPETPDERLDACREALGDWINRGVVPGAIPACIEALREDRDRLAVREKDLEARLRDALSDRDEAREAIHDSRRSLGPWIDRGVVPGALSSSIEALLEYVAQLRAENAKLRSLVWAQTNATTALHDFVTELLEAQRLASQVPSLFADEDVPPEAL